MTPDEKRELAQLMMDTVPTVARMLDMRMRGVRPRHRLHPPHITLLKRLKDGPLVQGDLADVLMVGGSTLSATLDALERRGWVKRTRLESDRRMVQIELTTEGAAVLADIQNYAYQGLRDMIESLSEDEARQALAGLRVLRAVIERAQQAEAERNMDDPRQFDMPMPAGFGPEFFQGMPTDEIPMMRPLPPDFVPPVPPVPPIPPMPPMPPFGRRREKRKNDDKPDIV